MRRGPSHLVPLFLAAVACGPSGTTATTGTGPGDGTGASNPGDKPIEKTTLAAVGLDPAAIDSKADPCADFYQYACGAWEASNEIPADKARYGRFDQINDRNEEVLHGILDEARTAAKAGGADPVTQAIGNYYGACMDEDAVEKAGTTAIDGELAMTRKIKNRKSLEAAIASLNSATVWVPFNLGPAPDFKDATRNIAYIGQGGLGLPDRDYYLKDDGGMKALRDAYRAHVSRTFQLIGYKAKAADKAADQVLALETKLAAAARPREELRDPQKTYNKIDRAGLAGLMPKFNLDAYFTALGRADVKDISVDAPDFFKALDKLMSDEKADVWSSYLTYHVVRDAGSTLPKRFVDEMFSLSSALSGAKELRTRWKRCASSTDRAMGEYLAQPFVAKMFTPEAKSAADTMVTEISAAMGTSIDSLPWMSAETKAKAHDKLKMVSYLVGYPATWKSYDFKVDPSNYAANAIAAARFDQQRELAKIGQPYDRSEWGMTPPTVNAYYNPLANQMVFPAGILQSPFFAAGSHVAVNLGAMGMVVGHELTHGFDDEGAKFAGDGNMRDWWQAADLKEFEARGECVADQYAAYQPMPDAHINGKLTLGENIADIGGVKIAFKAYRHLRQDAPAQTVADGYTEDQMFFLAVGQAWCSKSRDEEARRRLVTDPHSPPHYRVVGALSDLPEFAEAWSCQKGTTMAPEQACQVW